MKKSERSDRRIPTRVIAGVVVLAVAATAVFVAVPALRSSDSKANVTAAQPQSRGNVYYPTKSQWATITAAPAKSRVFQQILVTDGKIAVDEDRSTPVYSPYTGRITRLEARAGEAVRQGQLLFAIDATDTVEAQNDFISAVTSVAKAKSQLELMQISETRQKFLYEGKATPLKDWQQAQADLTTATNDKRSADSTLEASWNRLRILGKSDEEIGEIRQSGKISAETPVVAPIAGTVVQRRAGPGQYVSAGASDPQFVIGDLSTVWLTANVREADVTSVVVGQPVSFKVMAYPDRTFTGRLDYIATAVDSATRRLAVRATIDNSSLQLKPEMFASVSIAITDTAESVGVSREAVLHEGEATRVWVVTPDNGITLRQVRLGVINGDLIQVLDGISPGESVVTRGSLFIDRVATLSRS